MPPTFRIMTNSSTTEVEGDMYEACIRAVDVCGARHENADVHDTNGKVVATITDKGQIQPTEWAKSRF